MPYAKANPQVEYREQQARRAEHSGTLAYKDPRWPPNSEQLGRFVFDGPVKN